MARGAVAAFTIIALSACTSSYLQAGPPAGLLAQHRRTSIQLGYKDGRIVMLRDPMLERDTVWGRIANDPAQLRTGVALSDIEWAMAEGDRFNVGKTVILAWGTLATGLLLAVAAVGGL